ncbi:MAG TPA: OpgC domain-containing protein [Terriglobales bacterium]
MGSPTQAGAVKPQGRLLELDALRGLMLVWITLTHLPTNLSKYVNQPLGYVAATEGFIFLSALFTGFIYFRLWQREGVRAMCLRLWMRAGRLYCYHLSLLLVAFLIGAPIAARGYRPALHNLLDYYFVAGRYHAFVDAAFLLYRPPLLDILPIYIIFLVATPIVLILAGQRGWRYVLSGSFLLWLFAQFGFRSFVHDLLGRSFGLQIPLNQMGAFDLWAWQFWWVVGVWFGVHWVKGDLALDRRARQMVVLAAILASFFLVLHYADTSGLVDIGRFGVLLNKWDFGLGRIVDAAALATLAIRFRSPLSRLAIWPLVLLGQASLEVFCTQLFCVFVALIVLGGNPVLTGRQAAGAVLITLSVMFFTALIIANRRAKKTERRIPLLPQPPIGKAAA